MKILRVALLTTVLLGPSLVVWPAAMTAAAPTAYSELRANTCSSGITPALEAAFEAESAAWARNDVVVEFQHNPFPGFLREPSTYRHRTQYTELLYSHFPGLIPAQMVQTTNFAGPGALDRLHAACIQAP